MTTELAQGLEFYNSVPKRLEVLEGKKPSVGLPIGLKSADYYQLPSSFGTTSATGTQYVIQGQPDTLISKYFLEEATIQISGRLNIAGGANEPACMVNGYSGVRAMPLLGITQSQTMQINGKSITLNPQDVLYALLSFNKSPELDGKDLVSASMLDAFADSVTPAANGVAAVQSTCPTNAYRDYFSTVFSGNLGRLSSIEIIDIANPACNNGGNADFTITFRVREPIVCGATDIVNKDSGCFSGVNTLQFNRVFTTNLFDRLFHYAPSVVGNTNVTNTITNKAVKITESTLYYCVFTPIDSFVPKVQYHHFVDYDALLSFKSTQVFPAWTGANQPVANAKQIVSGNIQLNRIPKALYIWIAMSAADKNVYDTDSMGFHINNLQINYNNVPSIFNSMNDVQLYQEFSNLQGYIKTYPETMHAFRMVAGADYAALAGSACGLYGSCLRIDGTQLAAALNWDKYTVGSDYTANMSVKLSAYNLSKTDRTPTLFIQPVYDSWLVIEPNSKTNIVNSILDSSDIMKVRQSGNYEFEMAPVIGAGLFGKHGKKLAGLVSKHKGTILKGLTKGLELVSHKLDGGRRKSKKSGRRHYKGGSLHDDESQSESDYEEYDGGNVLTKADIRARLY